MKALAVAAGVYVAGYLVARSTRCLVMHEYYAKEDDLLIREESPGIVYFNETHYNARFGFKHAVFYAYRPMATLEDALRGYRKPIKTPNQALQHNDRDCHGLCGRPLRASHGRG